MILRLDPRIPMVWRDPFSLQFGVEPARVILRDVSSTDERLISTLAAGISDSGYEMIADTIGASRREATALLAQLAPVLDSVASSSPASAVAQLEKSSAPTVEIVGDGPTTERIARALAQSGCRVSVVTHLAVSERQPDFGLAVGHYVFDPAVYGHWLRRDIPHLPVVFADGVVTIGPVVDPGLTACLHCVEFYRRDADPRWSTLAAQLWGTRSAAETPLVSREAAAVAARMALVRVRTDRDGTRRRPVGATAPSFRIDVETGSIARTEWVPHADCGCCSIGGQTVDAEQAPPDVSAALRGSDFALVRRTTVFPPLPRRARVADAPA